jgi:hypothetical protein
VVNVLDPVMNLLQDYIGEQAGSRPRATTAQFEHVQIAYHRWSLIRVRRVFSASWQRCRVHWMRNALAYVAKSQQNMVAAALRQAFIQPNRRQAHNLATAKQLHRSRPACRRLPLTLPNLHQLDGRDLSLSADWRVTARPRTGELEWRCRRKRFIGSTRCVRIDVLHLGFMLRGRKARRDKIILLTGCDTGFQPLVT